MNNIQLDFQQVKAKHLQFKTKLRSILYGLAPIDDISVLSEFECPVGKWIYGHAMKNYNQLPEIQEIEKIHATVHNIARRLISLYKNDHVQEARLGLNDIEKVAGELLALIESTERKLVNAPSDQTFDQQSLESQKLLQTFNDIFKQNQELDKQIKLQSEGFVQQQIFYREILSVSPVVLFKSNRDGVIIYLNSTWHRWKGDPYNDSTAETMAPNLHPEDRDAVMEKYWKCFAARKDFEMEYRMVFNGKIKWCLSSSQPIYDSENNFKGYVGSITDITERKISEQLINQKKDEARETLHNFFMQAPAILCILKGPEHVFELTNPLYKQLIGNREVVGMTVKDGLPEISGQGFIELLDNVYNNNEVFVGTEIPVKLDRGNGLEDIIQNFIYQPIVNSKDEVEGILVFASDVTDLVKARTILEQSEDYFRKLSDLSPQIIWTASAQGKPDYTSQGWYDFSGFARDDGHSWLDIIHPDDKNKCLETWLHCTETGNDYNVEYRFKDRLTNEYRWFLGRAQLVKDENGKFVKWYGTFTDIHDQKTFEDKLSREVIDRTRQLTELNATLVKSNAELAQFAYIASHDLQEPLRKINTFSNFLQKTYSDGLLVDGQDYLQKIILSVKRMSQLITDLLHYSSISDPFSEFRDTDLNLVVQEVLSDLEVEIKNKQATINVSELLTLPVIPVQMAQLFQNLLSNSLKFARNEVPVEIKITSRCFSNDEERYQQLNKSKHYVEIILEDNGIGFDQKYEEKIFTIFQRLNGKSNYPGTGIGLSICKKIIETHGGMIFAHSLVNEGATFHIVIPTLNG